MLVKNFKAIIDAFDKATDGLKDATTDAITAASKGELKSGNINETINAEFRRLRSFVLDAVVCDETENAIKTGGAK